MASRFGQTGQNDLPKVRDILRQAFGEAHSTQVNEAMIGWKYWQPRADWDGSRGYALSDGDCFQAHAGILPLVLEGNGARLSTLHFIDWAALPVTISAGAKLLKRLSELADVTLAIGGSPATRRLLPMLKFQAIGSVRTLARPIRPWLQARTHQRRNWKLPPRLLFNTWWSATNPIQAPAGWDCVSVQPSDVPDRIWSAKGEPGTLWRRRDAGITAYYLACPGVRFGLFLARENREPQGCFLLSFLPGVAKIADLWVVDPTRERYECMYRLATVAAHQDGGAAEMLTYSSIESRTAALERAGFRIQLDDKLMALSRSSLPQQAIDCQMLDNDTAFLHGRNPFYLT